MKKSLILTTLALAATALLQAAPEPQTVSQIGFVVKQTIPTIENIAVIFNMNRKDQVEAEARSAVLITKKKIQIFGVSSKPEIAQKMQDISGMGNVAVVVLADDSVLNAESVKFIAQKLGLKKIPVISTRQKDTGEGALITIIKAADKIEKHINKKLISVFGLNIPAEALADFVVDVE